MGLFGWQWLFERGACVVGVSKGGIEIVWVAAAVRDIFVCQVTCPVVFVLRSGIIGCMTMIG